MIGRSEVYGEPDQAGARPARARALAGQLALCGWLMAACTEPLFEPDAASPPDASDEADAAEPDASSAPDASDTEYDAMDEQDAEAGASDASSGTMDAGAALDAAQDGMLADAVPADASVTEGATGQPEASQSMTQVFPIPTDEDDAVWYVSDDFDDFRELLHFVPAQHMSSGHTIEVGGNGSMARAGVRFRLPLAPGARVTEAKLSLKRMAPDENLPTDTMRVQVFEADDVPAFNGTHYHVSPEAHGRTGLWGISVGGFAVGRAGDTITSPDLSILVQHVVDRPGWRSGAYVGFVLFPEFLGDGFAPLGDSFDGQGASLRLTWRQP